MPTRYFGASGLFYWKNSPNWLVTLESLCWSIQLSVTIPPEDLELQAADHGWSGTLDLVFSQCDKAGHELANDGKELKIELSQQRYEAFLKEGLTLRRNLTLEAAASEIRFVLYDRVSGRVGSLRFPAR